MTDKPPTTTYRCAVIGNPIAHSRSPEIHAGFAAARGIALRYDRILAADEADFAATVARFFADGGRGLNITVPYKQTAYRLCGRTTPYAAAAEAVNTLWMENGQLCGDNTDGRGLRLALQEHGTALTGARILILGAGGAARGVILPLCEAAPAALHLANRTLANAEAVIASQQALTAVPLAAYALTDLAARAPYDLIINATSTGLTDQPIALPANLVHSNSRAYDMQYGKSTPFLAWAAAQQITAHDGYSMLVAQAHLSFQQWFPL